MFVLHSEEDLYLWQNESSLKATPFPSQAVARSQLGLVSAPPPERGPRQLHLIKVIKRVASTDKQVSKQEASFRVMALEEPRTCF
jgi:hypothetical protein